MSGVDNERPGAPGAARKRGVNVVPKGQPVSEPSEDQEEALSDRWFNPHRYPRSKAAKAIVQDVTGQLQVYESHFELRKRARRKADQETFEATVAAIVSDLMYHYVIDHEGGVAITRSNRVLGRRSRYRPAACGKTLPTILDMMTAPEMDFLKQEVGGGDPFGPARSTTIYPSERLISRIKQDEIGPKDFGVRNGQEVIILKRPKESYWDDGGFEEYEDTDLTHRYCRAVGCSQSARAGTGDGLDRRYCRRHADHHQRHGSPFVESYPAKVVNPYRRAAFEWLLAHPDDFWVKHAIRSVQGLYQRAGRYEEAFRLRGLTPRQRTKAHWARLRHHEVDPRLIVAVWLGVEMAVIEDAQSPSGLEYKRVQAAKIVHRMASGTHKRWGNQDSTGPGPSARVVELHVYPQSRGRTLRHIGKDLERACEGLTDQIQDALALKAELQAAGRLGSRPYPKSSRVRRRSV